MPCPAPSPAAEPSFALLAPGAFAERQRWARRRGVPDWLWPDVTRTDWLRAQGWIEEVARAILCTPDVPFDGRSTPVSAEVLGLAGYISGMGPLLGWWHQQERLILSPSIGAVFDLHLAHNRRRMTTMAAAASQLAGVLQAQGIRAVLLKGMHTAHGYFPDPGTRPLSDIDLLVASRDRVQAEALLAREAYRESSRTARESSWRRQGTAPTPLTLTFNHADDPWTVDLHHALDIPVAGGGEVVSLDRMVPMETREQWPCDEHLAVLEQPLLLLHLAAHAGAGLHNMTMIRLVELHLVITRDRAAGRLDWDQFLARGAAAGVLRHAWPALHLCERLVPGTVPQSVLADCAAQAPARVRKLVVRLSPARAQRLGATSLREHFMWAGGALGLLRQAGRDVVQPGLSMKQWLAIYERRAWQVVRGAFGR